MLASRSSSCIGPSRRRWAGKTTTSTNFRLAASITARPAAKTSLADVLRTARSKIIYVYDFGDEWRHEVRLERVLSAGENEPRMYCLDGARAGPPEDVGGPFGYAEWLEMLTSGDESERSEAQEVLGEDFDAERFDLDAVNQRLKKAA